MSVLRRVRESERMWTDLEALYEGKRGLRERSIQALFDATLGLRVRNASYRSVLKRFGAEEVSHQVATSDLRALVNAGLLEQRGKKRGTFYVAAEPLEEIRSRARERRQAARRRLPVRGRKRIRVSDADRCGFVDLVVGGVRLSLYTYPRLSNSNGGFR